MIMVSLSDHRLQGSLLFSSECHILTMSHPDMLENLRLTLETPGFFDRHKMQGGDG